MRYESTLLKEWTWSPTYYPASGNVVLRVPVLLFLSHILFQGFGDKAMCGVGIQGHVTSSNYSKNNSSYPHSFHHFLSFVLDMPKELSWMPCSHFHCHEKSVTFWKLIDSFFHCWCWEDIIQTFLVKRNCNVLQRYLPVDCTWGRAPLWPRQKFITTQEALLHFLFSSFTNVILLGNCFLCSSVVAVSFNLSWHCLLCAKVLNLHLATCPLGKSSGRCIGP